MEVEKKAVFLDRDGVINVDHGYVSDIADFEFTDGLFPVLRYLMKSGYLLVIVTNQSGIGRGYYTQQDFDRLTGWMLDRLTEEKIEISGVYSCPHSPESDCDCRKPAPGMFIQAIREHGIDPEISWMIGDKSSDMEAAAVAGVRNRVLLGNAVSGHNTHSISKISELPDLPI